MATNNGNGTGKPMSIAEMVSALPQENRVSFYNALEKYMVNEPVSMDKIQRDFSNLSQKDRIAFMQALQYGAQVAKNAELDSAWDKALADAIAQHNAMKGVA